MPETKGSISDADIMVLAELHYGNGVYRESTLALARAILALAAERAAGIAEQSGAFPSTKAAIAAEIRRVLSPEKARP